MISQEFQVHTFGCKVNTYDSGMLQKNLKTQLGKIVGDKKIHVLNTCAVTAEATKEAVRLARRIKANDPLALIVVTGCAAQVDTDSFSGLPGVDLVVANSHKGMLSEIIRDFYKGKDQKVFKSTPAVAAPAPVAVSAPATPKAAAPGATDRMCRVICSSRCISER